MDIVKRYMKNINLLIGLLVIVGFLLVMITSFFYTPYDVNMMNIPEKLHSPSSKYLFGTDEFGRDIFSRMMKGTQTAFAVGLLTVIIGTSFGILIGGLAGFLGGWVDELFMRLMDALMAFPGIILALMLVAVFEYWRSQYRNCPWCDCHTCHCSNCTQWLCPTSGCRIRTSS